MRVSAAAASRTFSLQRIFHARLQGAMDLLTFPERETKRLKDIRLRVIPELEARLKEQEEIIHAR